MMKKKNKKHSREDRTIDNKHPKPLVHRSSQRCAPRRAQVLEGAEGENYEVAVTRPGAAAQNATSTTASGFGPAPVVTLSGFPPGAPLLGEWRMVLRRVGAGDFRSLPPDEVRAAWLLLRFATA